MLFVTVRTSNSTFDLVTAINDLAKLLHVLENSSDVVKFKVSDGTSSRTQKSFGFGDFTKFEDKIYD